jgi:hypothetical protein
VLVACRGPAALVLCGYNPVSVFLIVETRKMIPVRALLLNSILHSLCSVGAMALLMASLLEWGLIAEQQTGLL